MKDLLKHNDIKEIIDLALREDIGDGDITTNAVFKDHEITEAVIIAKENAVFCGGDVVKLVYDGIDPGLKIDILKQDGEEIFSGEQALKINGTCKSILTGERTAMNFLGHMCGVASMTRKYAALLKGTDIKLLDTRKTLPGFRLLDKFAVKAGGGENHRTGLYDMVLIKDNHIKASGSISNAVEKVIKAYSRKYKIEVETSSLEEVKEALNLNIDIIMLDNMDKEMMKKAVEIINGKVKIEVSGNINEQRILEINDLKIDYISTGAITHSVRSIDLSMKFV